MITDTKGLTTKQKNDIYNAVHADWNLMGLGIATTITAATASYAAAYHRYEFRNGKVHLAFEIDEMNSRARTRINQLNQHLNTERQITNSLRQQVNNLSSGLSTEQGRTREVQNQLNQANQEKAKKVEKQQKKLQEEVNNKKKQLEKNEQEKARLQAEIENLKIGSTNNNAAVLEKLNEAQEQQRQLGEKTKKLQTELNDLAIKNSELVRQLAVAKEKVDQFEQLEKKASQQAELVKELQGKLATNQIQIENLDKENKQLKVEKAELEKANKQDQSELIRELEARIERNRGVTNLIHEENTNLREQMTELQNRPQKPKNLDEAQEQAKKAIQAALEEGYILSEANGDIIPAYQGYQAKINKPDQSTRTHQELSEVLKSGENILLDDKDKEEEIFEKRRLTRQHLDALAEEDSPEAKQAYQAMNKNDRFLAILKEENYNEGSWQYELYWILQGIAKEYAKSHLNNEKIELYPRPRTPGTYSDTAYKLNGAEGFDITLTFEISDLAIIFTFLHEIAHDRVMIDEHKGLLPPNQVHSLPF
ncbi:17009_t:CDS:2 [Funneliformis caledonium]|uniref:17009_t:CDS:1 n=1 Tax=Funneliformis caledonium TaxID=1117310 RepID=A0A9N9CC54_9GLOM|nr:17009_t:CDS:2 [Funneliformis caledonium]